MTVAVIHSLLLLLQVADGFHVHLLRLGQHRRLASKESSRSTIGTSARFFDKDVSNHYRTQVDISECVVEAENLMNQHEMAECTQRQLSYAPPYLASPAAAQDLEGSGLRGKIKDETLVESLAADVANIYLSWFVALASAIKVVNTAASKKRDEAFPRPWLEASIASTAAAGRILFF